MPAFLYLRWKDMDVPRVHKMKGAAKCLDDGFLDRPQKRRGLGQVSACQLQCLVKLLYVEDPVHGVAFLEFGASGHIDADIRFVAAEGGPDFFAGRAEGDGRAPVFSHQEVGPAQRIVDQPNRECDPVGEVEVFPEEGDETATDFRPTGYGSGEGCGVPLHGGIEDDTPARNETHRLNETFLAILRCGRPHRFEPRHGETRCRRIVRTCMIVRP